MTRVSTFPVAPCTSACSAGGSGAGKCFTDGVSRTPAAALFLRNRERARAIFASKINGGPAPFPVFTGNLQDGRRIREQNQRSALRKRAITGARRAAHSSLSETRFTGCFTAARLSRKCFTGCFTERSVRYIGRNASRRGPHGR